MCVYGLVILQWHRMIFWRYLVEIPLVCNLVLSRNFVYDICVSLIQIQPQ